MTKVWIDQDLCTGDGICAEICPSLFGMHSDDGLAYVKESSWSNIYNEDGAEPKYKMSEGSAEVPENLLEEAIEAAEECPGECIFFDL